MEYHGIKWIDNESATRLTREVCIAARIFKGGNIPFVKDGEPLKDFWTIIITGQGDTEHHLVEDAAILLSKMCDKKCGQHGTFERNT